MPPKPNFVDRHTIFMNIFEFHAIINDLEIAYEATHNERVFSVIQRLKAMQATARENEVSWAKEDIQVVRDNPYFFPHSVVTWATGYRDDELS